MQSVLYPKGSILAALIGIVVTTMLPVSASADSTPTAINASIPATEVDQELRSLLMQTVNDTDGFDDRFDAQVWLVDMSGRLSRFIKNRKSRLNLLKLVHNEATRAGLKPEIVLSVIQVESGFNRFAISRVGAQGLMQVMPFWKDEIGRSNDNLTNIQTNLRYGCTILKHYLNKEKGDLIRALARYNGSLGRLRYPEKIMDAWQQYWFVNNI